MTSLPAARARATLVEARLPVDPIGRTVAVQAPVENAGMIGVLIVVLAAGRTVRASVVARC